MRRGEDKLRKEDHDQPRVSRYSAKNLGREEKQKGGE